MRFRVVKASDVVCGNVAADTPSSHLEIETLEALYAWFNEPTGPCWWTDRLGNSVRMNVIIMGRESEPTLMIHDDYIE